MNVNIVDSEDVKKMLTERTDWWAVWFMMGFQEAQDMIHHIEKEYYWDEENEYFEIIIMLPEVLVFMRKKELPAEELAKLVGTDAETLETKDIIYLMPQEAFT